VLAIAEWISINLLICDVALRHVCIAAGLPLPDITKWSEATFRYIVLSLRRRRTGPPEPFPLAALATR